jgi:ligand-binding sensor domain-containing protein/signal transduction histidine kinase
MRFGKSINLRKYAPSFRIRSLLRALLTLALMTRILLADEPDRFLFQRWDTSSGLPHNTVRAIAQTPVGYLWLGTENGLARFDGVRFENFGRENTPVLQNPNVEFLDTDVSGTLWVGTGNHVYTWDGRQLIQQYSPVTSGDRFDHLLYSNTNAVCFSTVQGCLVQGIRLSATNWQWTTSLPAGPSMFAVDSGGTIWRLTLGGKLWRMKGLDAERVDLSDDAGLINQMTADAAGHIWLGTENELLVEAGDHFQSVATPPGLATVSNTVSVTEIFPTKNGAVWIVGNEHLWKWQRGQWILDGGAWTASRPVSHQSPLRHLLEDRRGGLWFSKYGHGLIRLDSEGKLLEINSRNGLPGDLVRSLFQDSEGNLWVGLDRGGLVKLRAKFFESVGTDEGLSEPVVLGVCEDAQGAIWATTYGGGLNRWGDGKFTYFSLGPDGSPGYVFTVFPDRDGRLWVGTRDNGVFIQENESFRHPFSTNAITAPVRAIYQARNGTVWLGSGDGVFRWQDSHLDRFAPDSEVAHADIRGFAEDPEGGLWIATHGNGLHRFLTGQHTALHTADGLPNEYVRSLFADHDGTVWVGMYGGGLLRWKQGKLASAAPPKNLPDDVICHIEEDSAGQLWIGTHHGLFRVAKSDLNAYADGRQKNVFCIVYDKHDGLPAVEFSGGIQPAGWHARDGRLWFATDNGLVSLLPADVTVNSQPPPVTIESVRVDGELFASSLDGGPAVQDLRRTLRIPAGRTQFEFQYTALSFTAPDNVHFQYRLDGLEKNWMDAGMNRMAAYNYLPPGSYKFQVRAANNDGVWNETGATVSFELLPHFWQRWWFRSAMVAVVIGLTWLAYERRMARLRELERLRLRIARDLHDDVGANLASVALIAEAMEKQPAFGDPADLRRIALHTIDSLRDIVWFIDPSLDHLGDLASRMRDTTPLLLAGMKYDFEAIVPHPDLYLPPAYRRNVFPIFKEALHNTVSHAQANRVSVTLDCRDGLLRLKVKDDGIGFVEEKIIPGNGLRNLRRRAAEMNGEVHIQTAPGEGTLVEFSAPFPQMRGFHFKLNWLKLNGSLTKK